MTATRARRRVALRDQLWAGASVVTSVGPLPVPPRADLVRALRLLAEHGGVTRVGWLSTGDCAGWVAARDLDAYCDIAVQELLPIVGEDPGGTAERIYALGRRGLPVSIVTCGDSISMNTAHVMADGYHMGRLLHAVIETAYSGELPPWATRAAEDRPLRSALWNFFGRQPERVVALRALLGTQSDPATPDPVSSQLVPWRPSAACVMQVSTPAALSELKRWRKANAPGVSSAALNFAVAERARVELGHPSTTPPLVLFDARRYLGRRDREVPGNFCAGLFLDVAEPFLPQAFHDRMGSAAELGRPLTALSMGLLRTRLGTLRGGHRRPPQQRSVDPSWNTAHTFMGRPPDIARLPWLDDGRMPYYIGMLTPAGPNGVTLGYTEIGNRINVSASFNDNVIDRTEVAAMLDLMCADPARLLDISAGIGSGAYVAAHRAVTPPSATPSTATASSAADDLVAAS